MPLTADSNFVMQSFLRNPRKPTILVAASLVIAAVSAPILGWLHLLLLDVGVRKFFSYVCHEIPDRSFWIGNEPVAICIRCFGIYSGAVFGALFRLPVNFARKFLLITALLNAVDVGAETWGLHGNMPALRFALGIALGVAAGALACARLDHDREGVAALSREQRSISLLDKQAAH